MHDEHEQQEAATSGIDEQHILPWVRALLTTTAARWQQLTTTLPEELLTRIPAPGEWSAVDCLRHLLDAERTAFPARVRAFLTGQDLPAFSPQGREPVEPGLTAAQLAALFAEARQAGLEILAQVTEQDLARTARHSELGIMTLSQMLHTWAAHDLNHTVQAERALMQPFIQGAGALSIRFQDHVVKHQSGV